MSTEIQIEKEGTPKAARIEWEYPPPPPESAQIFFHKLFPFQHVYHYIFKRCTKIEYTVFGRPRRPRGASISKVTSDRALHLRALPATADHDSRSQNEFRSHTSPGQLLSMMICTPFCLRRRSSSPSMQRERSEMSVHVNL